MRSSLTPVLASIVLTEFEETCIVSCRSLHRFMKRPASPESASIVSNLLKDGTIKYYRRYVDDTLVLIKLTDIFQ